LLGLAVFKIIDLFLLTNEGYVKISNCNKI
jgi:hypothetical protein